MYQRKQFTFIQQKAIKREENLNRLGHLKDFELYTIKDYIENLEKLVDNTIKENMDLKDELHRRKAQVEILRDILDKNLGNLFLEEE